MSLVTFPLVTKYYCHSLGTEKPRVLLHEESIYVYECIRLVPYGDPGYVDTLRMSTCNIEARALHSSHHQRPSYSLSDPAFLTSLAVSRLRNICVGLLHLP